jgi:hypothetical protein
VLIPPSSPVASAQEDEDNDSSLVGTLFRLLRETPPDLDPLLLVSAESNATDADLKKAGINKKDRITVGAPFFWQ